ncbi:hypothetical protein DFJ73DRAFT_780212 [Zopfochytrium polystomum]|nr:hypothetical protein DFJ73DRAFT_780212 [Zopfochytrium polystomum]
MDKRHAEVVTLADVHQHDAAMAGACVRVLGCFKHFDPVLNMAVLSYGALDLLVDTSLLGVMDRHNPKVLYQVVGDLEWLEGVVPGRCEFVRRIAIADINAACTKLIFQQI